MSVLSGARALLLSLTLGLIAALMPAYKWLLSRVTGRCQLLRLMDRPHGARRTDGVERCLSQSQYPLLRQAVRYEGGELSKADLVDVAQEIARNKDIKEDVHTTFEAELVRCLLQVLGYQRLVRQVDGARREKFRTDEPRHCALLQELWGLLEPDQTFPGIRDPVWETLGFQCDEPYTDLRGMGLLALHNLIYFASTYPEAAQRLLSLSRHPEHGYSFAIVSVNLTDLTVRLLRDGRLRFHFYNQVTGAPCLEHFHDAYCWLFVRFDEFWRAQGPIDVMEFNRARDRFSAWLSGKLRHKHFRLRPAF